MFAIKINIDNTKAINFFKQSIDEFVKSDGLYINTLKDIGKELAINAADRFSSNYSGRKADVVRSAILRSGFVIKRISLEQTTLLMFPVNVLDRLTSLPPTVVTGQVYSLWRLLSAGFGMRGSHDTNKGHTGETKKSPYPLFVIIQNESIVGASTGRYPPYPELVALESNDVLVIRHPGFRGKEWFLRNGNLYIQDTRVIKRNFDKMLRKLAK